MTRVSIHAPLWGATTINSEDIPADDAGFNPRTPTGCDNGEIAIISGKCMFQSTHPYGVRLDPIQTPEGVYTEFQSTHPYGVRLIV